MKRMLCTALSAALAFSLAVPASAASVGDVVGHIYATDIVAQIDGHPLRSYNLGDATLVVAEDLREYGFTVTWDGEARTLTVERDVEGTVTGTYQPPVQTQTVGTQVGNIYATDIQTYVQGVRVESFALDGVTAIRFSELERAGTFTWSEETRISALTLAEDPMEETLNQLRAEVENWNAAAGSNSSWEEYPNAQGVFFVAYYSGTPHGGSCTIAQVKRSGALLTFTDSLPGYPVPYLAPRDIQVDETGRYVTFITPVKEVLDYTAGTAKEYGDCWCTFDTETGALTWEPMYTNLSQWSARYEAETWPEGFVPPTPPLSDGAVSWILVKRQGGSGVENWDGELPSYSMYLRAGQDGITLVHQPELFDGGFSETNYGAVYQRLRALDLPDRSAGDTDTANTPEQREQVSALLQVEKNGEPVSGDLWWSQKDGDTCLNFTFDVPISMADGDQLTMRLALPE